ncbi:TRAP transporter large permease subunit [Faecalibacterium prausnitzii]|jgi:hypothetical protein|uniref:TRAP transporter large permease subunit n=1 Tax=Faecalibacterium prausnitzii TaxID=853 RepID=UPI0020B75BE6|nr:TRAP transporter large permease subunit [Faecalibacterium prausnitzii]MCQ5161985.1 TRAP transporter large permease subunit [Faecalibacterium prausnitzii]MCQ5175751.1 TRAP transporter large permease subunit [Faecalibacterium prausnitzii]
MTIKKTSKILLTVIVVVLLGIGVSTFFKVNGSIGSDKIQLRLAHGQAGDSEIGGTIAYLSDLVAEDESMNMEVSIYPSGVLVSETAMVELVQVGVLDMAKISANMMVMNLAVGTITPPVGNVLFVGCSLAKQRLENVMKSLVPFFVAIFISLMLVTYIPALSEWLPTTLGLM